MPEFSIQDRAVLEEYARRVEVQTATADLARRIKAELFAQQRAFVDDPAREKGALCTRRAGKTAMWARYARMVSLERPRTITRIWAVNRLRAKQLIWDELKDLDKRHRVECAYNETELTARLPNGSEIRLLGADKDKEVQKKRGDKTVMEVVLEAQLFGAYLKPLVEDVAGPCLFDLQGTFCLEGTPGPICAGYWWEVSGRNDAASRWTSPGGKDNLGAGWSMHRWSVLDNPHLPHARKELSALKKKRRWADDNPTFLREWRAIWVNDLGVLFYKFDPTRNLYRVTDDFQPWGPGWEHTLGWDLGFRDDMALVVWGFHPAHANLYEAFSWKKPGAGSSEIVEIIRRLETHGPAGVPLNFVARVADTGGGGRMYVEEVQKRHAIQFEAAKKTEKYEHARLMNDDFLGGFILLQEGSPYAEEISQLARDLDWPPPDKPEAAPREDPRCANHCSDAGLYGYRRAWHYLHVEEQAKPVPHTSAWYAAEVRRMEQGLIERAMRKRIEDPLDVVDAEFWVE